MTLQQPITISELANAVAPLALRVSEPDARVTRILTDSRSLTRGHDSVFFAISTPTNDGHRFISELLSRGVRNFVVAHPVAELDREDVNVLTVKDPLAALRSLSAARAGEASECERVAVGGSCGKTIVKEWISALVGEPHTVKSPRSFNSQIGVPLSMLLIEPTTRLAVIEAGVSQRGEMEALEQLIKPRLAVFTTLTDEHAEGFESLQAKAAEKALLGRNASAVVISADEAVLAEAVKAATSGEVITWTLSGNPAANIRFEEEADGDATTLRYEGSGHSGRVSVPFRGAYVAANLATAVSAAICLGVADSEITANADKLVPVKTRLDVIEGHGHCMLVNDTFTPDRDSLALALDFMRRRSIPGSKLTAIVGGINDATSREVAELLEEYGVSRKIGVGDAYMAHPAGFDLTYPSAERLLESLTPADFDSELILIKGRGFGAILEMLEASQHQTVLEVNLDAMVRNFNFFKSCVKPETGIVAMVKAFGYGAGSYELAKTLQSQGAAYLAVASHDEGVDLRRAGITMPIMVLNPRVANYRALFAFQLEPEIYSFEMLVKVITQAKRWGIKHYPVHIKLDTGMHRLGFRLEELPAVVDLLKSQDAVVAKSVFSHLCAADDPADDAYTQGQFEYFDRCLKVFDKAFPEGERPLRHILNSTGIVRFPERQYDMVRLGIGLYGVKTMNDGSMDALEPVSSLKSVVIAIREWEAGTTIGYNRRGVLKRPSRIATVPIGYADGLDRHLGYGNASVVIAGHQCPTVGSICMDVMMVDVTDAPECRVGSQVEIFGHSMTSQQLADTLQTIPYEILTSVDRRVKRVYYRE